MNLKLVSKVLPPFIVMSGKHDGTLHRRFSSWIEEGGDAKIAFQKSHWMDVRTAKVYLDFVVSLYPEDITIGLIWDAASSHICDKVKTYAAELGIVLGFIPAGLTSILQVCDLYYEGIENEAIRSMFNKCGQDPSQGQHECVSFDMVEIAWRCYNDTFSIIANDLSNELLQKRDRCIEAFRIEQKSEFERITRLSSHIASQNGNATLLHVERNSSDWYVMAPVKLMHALRVDFQRTSRNKETLLKTKA